MPSDIYLKFDGIDGDSEDKLNPKWIEIDNLQMSFSMPVTSERSAQGSATSGKVEVSPISFAKTMDTASLDLIKRAWTGCHTPKVEIRFYRAHGDGRTCYMRVELTDVVISAVGVAGMDGSGLPGENYYLDYGSIMVEYTPTKKTQGAPEPKPQRALLNRITNKVS